MAIIKGAKFDEGEKVLCYHRQKLYPAKCTQVRVSSNGNPEYRVHYVNWKSKWDEWVDEARVLKFNSTNLKKEQAEHIAKKLKEGGNMNTPLTKNKKRKLPPVKNLLSKTPNDKKESQDETSSKRSRMDSEVTDITETDVETEDNPQDLKIKIKLPASFHPFLLTDHENVTRNNLVYKLPVRWTTEKIAREFVASGSGRAEKSCFLEYGRTIQEFMDQSVACKLLYPHERRQAREVLKRDPDRRLSDVYGAAHLLRMLTVFGGLLSQCYLEQVHVDETEKTSEKFFAFLEKNSGKYFAFTDDDFTK